jgi:hypothetical protein
MNMLKKPTKNAQPSADASETHGLSVQRACILLLGSVMLLPAYAERATYLERPQGIVGQGKGPAGVVGQGAGPVPVGSMQTNQRGAPIGGGPTQGDGFVSPSPAPRPPSPPVAPPPAPTPPPVAPAPVKPPVKPVTAGPQAGPGPGVGPEKPPIQGAGPSTNIAVVAPIPPARLPDQPTQGTGPAAASRSVNSATPPSADTTTGPASVSGSTPPVGTPPQGVQPAEINAGGPPILSPTNALNRVKPPDKSGPSQGVGTRTALFETMVSRSTGGLGEILPDAQKLGESMQEQTASGKDTDANATHAKAKCTAVSLRPDTKRQAVSLVDLLGDGLIVAAVPDTHIQSVFSRAGYGSVDLSKAARWCVTPTVARELLQPARSAGGQDAALLVQTGGGMQLMSQDQWLAHQASLKPLVASMSAKSARSSKLAKASGRTLAKPTAKSSTGVTVGALRLPAGANKVAGTAS